MKLKANAKINLGLDIVRKREDGYHELNTLFCQLDLHDVIHLEMTVERGITISCRESFLSCGPDNLAYKGAAVLFEKYKPEGGVKIHIEKNIPMGAGLGGGSSDAAAVMKGVNELFGFGADNDELRKMAAALGADIPFFIEGGMAQAKGIGDKLAHFDGPKLPPMIIIKPEVSVPTGPAYKAVDLCENVFHPDVEKLIEAVMKKDYDEICRNVGNTFENAVFGEYPTIKEIKDRLLQLGAGACAMTGSGSALFALFKDEASALSVMEILKEERPELTLYPEMGGTGED